MCRLLGIPRSSYYYKAADLVAESELEASVEKIFLENQKRYGARKIKQKLEQEGVTVSRRRIRRVMKRLNLVSLYQEAAFKPYSKGKNEAPIPNHLDRQFDAKNPLEAIVTDLTYVRVKNRWAYVCFIIDLYNREIIEVNDETNVSPAPIHTDVSQVGHQGFQWSFLVKLPV